MRIISEQELKHILDKHGKWLRGYSRCEWRLAKSLDYSYWVSSHGQVASAIDGSLSLRPLPMILSLRPHSNGYVSISFRGRNKLVHRIIAQEFIGDVGGAIVHHKDGNRKNNAVRNLELSTLSKNNKGSARTRRKIYGQFIKMCAELFESQNKDKK